MPSDRVLVNGDTHTSGILKHHRLRLTIFAPKATELWPLSAPSQNLVRRSRALRRYTASLDFSRVGIARRRIITIEDSTMGHMIDRIGSMFCDVNYNTKTTSELRAAMTAKVAGLREHIKEREQRIQRIRDE